MANTQVIQQLDQYGRDVAERTVELDSFVAEAISQLVDGNVDDLAMASLKAQYEGGDPKTFDEALGYGFWRGLCEIKRQRDSAEKTRKRAAVNVERTLLKEMLKLNPALATDQNFVSKMLALISK